MYIYKFYIYIYTRINSTDNTILAIKRCLTEIILTFHSQIIKSTKLSFYWLLFDKPFLVKVLDEQ